MSLTRGQRETLQRKLTELSRSLDETLAASNAGAKPVDLDEPIGRVSRIDAIAQQKMLQANRAAARLRLENVRNALRRLETEEFGECGVCEEPIGFERLLVRPESALCVHCQGRRETRA